MLELHGLKIDIARSLDDPVQGGADVCWTRLGAEAMPDTPAASGWTHRVFQGRGGAACSVAVSADGRCVITHRSSAVRESDEFGLFAETVMRTVLRRLGLVSFHAAALARGGRAVLIMGEKAAGKSTYSAALTGCGWSLVCDDLARVVWSGGCWTVVPGLRQSRLRADAAAALGYDASTLDHRWTPGQPWNETDNKLVVAHTDTPGASKAVLGAIYVLGARRPGLSAMETIALTPGDRLALMMRNLSQDPFDPLQPPPASTRAAVLSLLGQVPVTGLALPDDLALVRPAAGELLRP